MLVTLMEWFSKWTGSSGFAVQRSVSIPLLSAVTILLWGATAQAYPYGIAGQSQAGCAGSGCHSGGSYSYSASFSGSTTVAPNAQVTMHFNLTHSGAKASVAGLDVSVVSGTVAAGTLAAGSNTRLTNSSSPDFDAVDGEIAHSTPQDVTGGNNGDASWDFLYTAPNGVGTVTLYGCGNPANGDGLNSGDGPSACTSQTVTINSSPTANNDSFSVNKNSTNNDFTTALSNDRSGNGSNDPGDSISISAIATGASHGTATRVNGTTLRYTPNAGYSGPDSFTYRITDSIGATATATVTVTVINHAPVANNDSYPASENSTLTVPVGTGVLINDSDPDGDSISATLVSTTSHGTLSFNSNGSFTYTPVAAFSGADSFTYRVSDGSVNSTNATVTINVAHVAFAPVATGESYSTNEDTTLAVPSSGVLANDTDANNDVLTAVLDTTTAHGALTLNSNGSFSYLPSANYNGNDSFTYHAFDGGLPSNTVTVNLTIIPVNDAPVATADTYSTNEDTTLVVAAGSGVLANDADVEHDPLTAVLVSNVGHGTLTFNSNGSFTYVPVANYNGPDNFTYRANDGSLNSNIVTVSITVIAVNDPPVAVAESYSTNEDTTLTVAAGSGVLANDTDVDGDVLTAVVVTTTAHGSLTLNTNGGFSYVPAANYNGSDSFTYRANDGQANSNTVTVNITVIAVNDPPVGVVDSYATDEDVTLTVAAANGVLANDTDVDGDALTATLLSSTTHGTLTFNADGSFSYIPNPHFRSADSFSYRASDGQANSSIVIVAINVRPVNHAPVASNDGLYSVSQNSTRNVSAATGVLANDTDPDGDPLSAALVSPPLNGTLTLGSDGSFSYMPNPNYLGPDQFTYRATDGSLTSGITTVSLVVVSPPPVITAPADIKMDATGYLTAVALAATATDSRDGVIPVTADTKSPLRPGHHVVTYTAQNAAGTTAVATQNVDIVPLAALGPDQMTGRGRTVDVEFFLNGSAVTYPVTLTYNVSGTATTADANVSNGVITINAGTHATLQIPIANDGGGNPDRTLVFTLASATNAALGANTTTTVTIVDRNIAPVVSLIALQQSQPRARVYGADDVATITADATDPDVGDTLTYDWTGTDAALPAPSTSLSSFTFCPVVACTGGGIVVPSGSYQVAVKVTDSHGATSTARWTLVVSSVKPALTLTDSDQDHINDVTEGVIDSWNTGLPDYLNPFDDAFVIPDRVSTGVSTHALETQPGLSLHVGTMSLSSGGTGALLITPPADGSFDHATGVFDFEVRGVQQTAGVASIVLPLQSELGANAVYRQYVSADSSWHGFTSTGTSDAVYSAPAVNGVCPGPDSSAWTTGLTAKAQCIRLTLSDGGPNDADGTANGVIVNVGGAATSQSSSSQSSSAPSGVVKGGGAIDWNWLWMMGLLLVAANMMTTSRRHKT